jgi:spermidine synthase
VGNIVDFRWQTQTWKAAFVAFEKGATNKQPIDQPSKTQAVVINVHFAVVKACSEIFHVCNGWALDNNPRTSIIDDASMSNHEILT